jgi:ribonucleoside-triphosphate reductase
MDPDKNRNDIEKLLRILGQKIRIDVLRILKNRESILPYSVLQKEALGQNQNPVNFTYHLKTLENANLIASSEAGYAISSLGKKILQIIISMEECIDTNHDVKLIRTSKYSKEIFDFKKIEEYLKKEGGLELSEAKKIAREVKKRLLKTNIKYLTAPLMREYINVVLIENDLEEVRHKLTRLGSPPTEVLKLFDSVESINITPEIFIHQLGSDVSEQFLLLNLLPNELADLYLSGEIALLNLNHWALRPLSIYMNMKTILDYISKENKIYHHQTLNSRDLIKVILKFINKIFSIMPFVSEDIVLGDFNNIFLNLLSKQRKNKVLYLFDILISQILNYNNNLCLDFHYGQNLKLNSDLASQFQMDELFLKILDSKLSNMDKYVNPLIMLDYSEMDPMFLSNLINQNDDFIPSLNDFVLYNSKSNNLMNSTVIKVTNFHENNSNGNNIILDKILINLHSIALKAKNDDNEFFELLQTKLNSVFKLFNYKEQFVKRKLSSLNEWKQIISLLRGKNVKNWYKDAIKSISFFGLNEAIETHCGIELDRLKTSESFGLKILSFLNNRIKEKNEKEHEFYVLSQPHPGEYRFNSFKTHNGYSPRIIRKKSNLPLTKQISIFKRFEEIINGGVLFNIPNDYDTIPFNDTLKILIESKIGAFSFQ